LRECWEFYSWVVSLGVACDLRLEGVLDEDRNQQVTKNLLDEPNYEALEERWENRVDLDDEIKKGNRKFNHR
jgi:hypothetical protein